jgi:hypothetical protein
MKTPKQRGKALRQLIALAKEVAYDAQNTPYSKITRAQEEALDDALRTLDLVNAYDTGDRLRKAFGVELDAVKFHETEEDENAYKQRGKVK